MIAAFEAPLEEWPSLPPGGACGTYGCILRDRHTGLHSFPIDGGEPQQRQPRQRQPPRAYEPTLTGRTYSQATVGNGPPGSRPQP